ncbi:hypothetical protein CWATWH8502_3341 [Crocosphaera watsonii WH 8502]|uniref:Primase C-terminal 2 domain-containing protein n=1 Tax=Crocosphaera watsonii WH 8502 TaxID=423474 RepID=T2IA25_CROWT|nr:hypothetical protein CWATWH8502_3341 [Crocosphaera watsonii WH 8502]
MALLDLIPSYYADDYDSWIKVGMALKSISPVLLEAWDRWSRQSKKWKPGECAYKWRRFNGVGISERTLYWLAQNSLKKVKILYFGGFSLLYCSRATVIIV